MLRAIGSRIAVARLPALLFSRISAVQLVRAYAASAGLARADVEARVLAVVKNTPKIAADKVSQRASAAAPLAQTAVMAMALPRGFPR